MNTEGWTYQSVQAKEGVALPSVQAFPVTGQAFTSYACAVKDRAFLVPDHLADQILPQLEAEGWIEPRAPKYTAAPSALDEPHDVPGDEKP